MIIYINGRGMNAPELKAYISELEAALKRDKSEIRELILNEFAEHIKNRLYETALNTNGAESDTITAMAERIDFWVSELKGGSKND